jgi:O-antigen ligase
MRAKEGVAVAATVMAVAVPLLVVHWALGHGIFAQMVSVGLWGLAIVAWAATGTPTRVPWRPLAPLLMALSLVALGVLASAVFNGVPAGVWLGSLGVLLAAAAVAVTGLLAARHLPEEATRALMWGLVLAASASLIIAALQLVAPGWTGSIWIAPARTPGRASANLVQPNHLATLLVWAWLAVAVWSARIREPSARGASAGGLGAEAMPPAGAWALMLAFAMQAGVAATASRAGLVASLVVAVWAALDLRLPRPSAWLLWSTALGGLMVTLGRVMVAPAASLGAGASLVRPGARSGVFVDTLQLIREHPLAGVGWMDFQLAWSLSPLGDRGPRYYEHAHNLVLNLVVELGLPLGLAICACLIWGAWELLRSVGRAAPSMRPRVLMLLAMLGAVGIHSLFDAPFWYAYLLLPAAWAWGNAVGLMSDPATSRDAPFAGPALPDARVPRTRAALALGGAAMACAAAGAWFDFRHVLPALLPATQVPTARLGPAATPGHSRLFGYYADREIALKAPDAAPALFRKARWVTIDTALLAAWIAALERAGRHDDARFLMQRALEFRDPAFGPWLSACRVVAPMEPPSRCRPPVKVPEWRQFR